MEFNLKRKDRTTIVFAVVVSLFAIVLGSLLFDRICVAYLLCLCLYYGKNEPKIINPFFLFALTPLSLLVYYNIGDAYMLNLTHKTWSLAIINIASFIVTLKVTGNFKHINNCKSVTKNDSTILGILFFALFSLQYLIPDLSSVLWILGVSGIVALLKNRDRTSFVVSALFVIVVSLSASSKMSMLCYSLTFLICLEKYYGLLNKKSKWTLPLMVLAFAFMIFSFSFANNSRGRYNATEGLASYTNQGVEWKMAASFFLPYMYFTTPWTNLQYVTETQPQKTYGLLAVKPLLGYVGLDEVFGIDDSEQIFEPYSSFNTYTFIACHFKDFGMWLSIISTIFLGWYVKKVYSRYLLSKSPLDVSVYVLVSLATAEMFFSNHFFLQSYPFTILIVMEIIKQLLPQKIIEIENK